MQNNHKQRILGQCDSNVQYAIETHAETGSLASVVVGMGLAEEILQTIASDYQMTLVADNHLILLELYQKFGHARA